MLLSSLWWNSMQLHWNNKGGKIWVFFPRGSIFQWFIMTYNINVNGSNRCQNLSCVKLLFAPRFITCNNSSHNPYPKNKHDEWQRLRLQTSIIHSSITCLSLQHWEMSLWQRHHCVGVRRLSLNWVLVLRWTCPTPLLFKLDFFPHFVPF